MPVSSQHKQYKLQKIIEKAVHSVQFDNINVKYQRFQFRRPLVDKKLPLLDRHFAGPRLL
jgi:hypothetical protein